MVAPCINASLKSDNRYPVVMAEERETRHAIILKQRWNGSQVDDTIASSVFCVSLTSLGVDETIPIRCSHSRN